MKTIGLIGGMSWESTRTYYERINQLVRKQLGGHHSAKLLLYSVDFAEIEALQRQGDWDRSGELLADAAQRLEVAGADLLLIATNTMHKVFDTVAEAVDCPLIHLADATAQCLRSDGIERVGLLGTAFTMEQNFYTGRLRQAGLQVDIPDAPERAEVHRIIYEELCCGLIREGSRVRYLQIIESLRQQGAQAVILGCTEIGQLVRPEDVDSPLYDTTEIHASAAVEAALA